MTTAKRLHYSYDEYLRLLAQSDFKLEYRDGVIYAITGGTIAHAALGAAMVRILSQAPLGKCTVYTSDLKVRVEASDLSTFSDVSIVCGPVQTSAIDKDALTNPTVLVGITSRSTEDYDRGDQAQPLQAAPVASRGALRLPSCAPRDARRAPRRRLGRARVLRRRDGRLARPPARLRRGRSLRGHRTGSGERLA